MTAGKHASQGLGSRPIPGWVLALLLVIVVFVVAMVAIGSHQETVQDTHTQCVTDNLSNGTNNPC